MRQFNAFVVVFFLCAMACIAIVHASTKELERNNLFDVDAQGHENESGRRVRQFGFGRNFGGGGFGRPGFGGGFGRPGFGGGGFGQPGFGGGNFGGGYPGGFGGGFPGGFGGGYPGYGGGFFG